MILEFNVNEHIVENTLNSRIVNLSQNYIELQFQFQENSIWDGVTHKQVLFTNGGRVYNQTVNSENRVTVPAEVLTEDYFEFSLYGVNESQRITTNKIRLYLEDSGYTDTSSAPDIPTPGVIDEILLRLDNTVDMTVVYDDDQVETFQVVVK